MVAKLLGDPTYFPIEFRRWLQDFLDNSDFKISQSQIIGGGAGGGSTGPTLLPAGIVVAYGGTAIGKDVLICNGAAISRETYKELFDAIGVTWGNGDGSTTFNVPDFRDRALFGQGTVVSVGGTDGKGSGSRGGPSHNHTVAGNTDSRGGHSHGGSVGISGAGGHTHGYYTPAGSVLLQTGTSGNYGSAANYSMNHPQSDSAGDHSHSASLSINSVGDHNHGFSGTTSGNSANRDGPSYAGVSYCITTGKSAA